MRSLSAPSYTLIDNNTLSIDTVHLVCYHYLDKSIWSKWTVGNKSERINSVITDIGEVKLVYAMKKDTKPRLSIEFSATKVLYNLNAATFHWDQFGELIARVKCIVESALNNPGIDITKLKVRRLDLAVNQVFLKRMSMLIQWKNMLEIYEYYKGYKEDHGTLYYYSCRESAKQSTINQAAVLKCYNKKLEIESQVEKGKANVSEIPPFEILRYELTLRADRLREVVSKLLKSELKYVSLATLLSCDPKCIFSEGLRTLKDENLYLKHIDRTSIVMIKADMLAAATYKKKVEDYFAAIEIGDSTDKFKKQRKKLNDLGYTDNYFCEFTDFCDPTVIS